MLPSSSGTPVPLGYNPIPSDESSPSSGLSSRFASTITIGSSANYPARSASSTFTCVEETNQFGKLCPASSTTEASRATETLRNAIIEDEHLCKTLCTSIDPDCKLSEMDMKLRLHNIASQVIERVMSDPWWTEHGQHEDWRINELMTLFRELAPHTHLVGRGRWTVIDPQIDNRDAPVTLIQMPMYKDVEDSTGRPDEPFPRKSWDTKEWVYPENLGAWLSPCKLLWAAREASLLWASEDNRRVSFDVFKFAILDRVFEL